MTIKVKFDPVEHLSTVTLNLNDFVYVRLNDHGRKVAQESPYSFAYEEDEDGWSKWQWWTLMNVFGPVFEMGRSTPFETLTVKMVQAGPVT